MKRKLLPVALVAPDGSRLRLSSRLRSRWKFAWERLAYACQTLRRILFIRRARFTGPLKYLELGSAQLWGEIERLTNPVCQRRLYLVSVNNFEQVAILYLLGRAVHGCEAFDFTWEEDPYFEKCPSWPDKEIADLF